MRNLILLVLVVFIGSTVCLAQENKFSLGLSGGTATPIGLWGKKDFQNSKATGFANTGLIYDLSLSYKLGAGNFGITALFQRQINAVDILGYSEALKRQNTSSSFSVESDDWRMNAYLIGGHFSKSISKKVDFQSSLLIGLQETRRPLQTTFGDEINFVTQQGLSSTTFAYLIGSGLKYHVGPILDFVVNVKYFISNPELEVIETSNVGFTGNSKSRQQMNSLNLSLGLAVNF